MTDELLIRFLLKETNEAEGFAVQEWLVADPANQLHFDQFEKIWKAGKDLAIANPRDEQEAWLRFQQRTVASAEEVAKVQQAIVKPMKPNFGWMKIAAMLLLVGGAWMAYQAFGPERYKNLVASNGVATELLPDGSELTLNKNAELSYASNFKRHRSVRLKEGEVFFNVAHDKSRPFVIEIGKVSVTVLGTTFNIKKWKDETEVIVESGIVRVALNGDKIELHKGEKIRIGPSVTQLIKESTTDQLYNYYRSNLFIANNTPLQKLTEVMDEAYGSQIVITDPGLAAEPFTTTFKVDDGLDASLNLICTALNLKMERNENKILLSRNK